MGEYTLWIFALVASSLLIAFGFFVVCVLAMVFAAIWQVNTKVSVAYRNFRAELGSTGPAPTKRDENGPVVVEGAAQDSTAPVMEVLPPPPSAWQRIQRLLLRWGGGEKT
jgi:hypothetical protein